MLDAGGVARSGDRMEVLGSGRALKKERDEGELSTVKVVARGGSVKPRGRS